MDNLPQTSAVVTRALAVEELPQTTISAIKVGKMDKRHQHLNDLLDE